jgi:N4-gp56 family major capsid protein
MYNNIYKLNLRMFDDVINKTTSNTTGNDLSPEIKTYYSDYLIDLAEAELVHDQFGQKRPIPAGSGKTIEFRQFMPLAKITDALVEGVTPDGQALDVSAITAVVKQYGGYVTLSDLLELTAIDNVKTEAVQLIGSQAGRSLDTVVREVLNGGTNVQYHNGERANRAAIQSTDTLTVLAIRQAVRTLKRQNAKPINGDYVGIIHPDAAFDLMSDPAWADWHKYTTPENMYNNEIGKIAGVRFVESTEAKIFDGAGDGGMDIYSTLILAANAYGTTDITGGGLQLITKQKGSAGTADPLDQRSTVGWKATKTAERLVEDYMVRIETACTYTGYSA